jgi:hypothetical protein
MLPRGSKMGAAVHQRRCLLEQRRADGIGALGVLGPVLARRQRHAVGAGQEAVVADGVQDGALGVGQHDHAFSVDDLLVEQLHDRRRMRAQALVALAREVEVAAHHRVEDALLVALQPQGLAALVAALDEGLSWRRQRRRARRPFGFDGHGSLSPCAARSVPRWSGSAAIVSQTASAVH